MQLDIDLFRFINTKLANPLFDAIMPFVSGNALFYPLLLVAALALVVLVASLASATISALMWSAML